MVMYLLNWPIILPISIYVKGEGCVSNPHLKQRSPILTKRTMQMYNKFIKDEWFPLINDDGSPTYQIMVGKYHDRSGSFGFEEIGTAIPGTTIEQRYDRQRACTIASQIFHLQPDEITDYFGANHPQDKLEVLNYTIDKILGGGITSGNILQKLYRTRCVIDPPPYAVINLCAWNINKVQEKNRQYRIKASEYEEIGRMFLHPKPTKDLCYKGENYIREAVALTNSKEWERYYIIADSFKEHNGGFIPITEAVKAGFNRETLQVWIDAGHIQKRDDTVSIHDLSTHFRKLKNFDQLHKYLIQAKELCDVVGVDTQKIDTALKAITNIKMTTTNNFYQGINS